MVERRRAWEARFAGIVLLTLMSPACGGGGSTGSSDDDGGSLPPARDVRDTWVTGIPVTMCLDDFSCFPGPTLGTQEWMMTRVVTGDDESHVFVQARVVKSAVVPSPLCSDFTPVPEPPSSNGDYGSVSGVSLSLSNGSRTIARFTFTTDLMQGTWDDRSCFPPGSSTCDGAYCATNAFKLQRRS